MTPAPLVVTIVVHWNEPEETARCLASLARVRYPAHEVVVVDNASTSEALGQLREVAKGATVLENRQNLGFAGGNNAGFEEAARRGSVPSPPVRPGRTILTLERIDAAQN